MATMPGMNADVFWGDPSKPSPDWRDHPIPDADDESDDPTPEHKSWVCGVLGVDPSFLDYETDADDPPVAESSPVIESAPDTAFNRLARKAAELWESGDAPYP